MSKWPAALPNCRTWCVCAWYNIHIQTARYKKAPAGRAGTKARSEPGLSVCLELCSILSMLFSAFSAVCAAFFMVFFHSFGPFGAAYAPIVPTDAPFCHVFCIAVHRTPLLSGFVYAYYAPYRKDIYPTNFSCLPVPILRGAWYTICVVSVYGGNVHPSALCTDVVCQGKKRVC